MGNLEDKACIRNFDASREDTIHTYALRHLPIPSHGSSEQRFTRDIRIRYSSDVSNFIGYLSLFSERYSFVSIIGSIRERNRC